MGLGLNLAGADLSGFDAIASGWYHCAVVELKMKETKGSEGSALPKGTPMINAQFKVVQEEDSEGKKVKNRRLFRQLIIAPDKVGGKKYEHKEVMDRILGQFFKALGYSDDEIKSGDFNPDFEEIKDKELLVNVGQKQKYGAPKGVMDNEVKGFRPLSGNEGSGTGLI